MLRFILYMILVFIAARIIVSVIASIRKFLTPNSDIQSRRRPSPFSEKKEIEDIPYEEIKEKHEKH